MLPFGSATVYKLIDIATNGKILSHAKVLPPSWNTLYALTQLSDEDFDAGIADGTINISAERPLSRPQVNQTSRRHLHAHVRA